MLPRADREHDLVVREDGRRGEDAAAERLAEHEDVRADAAVVVAREEAARAREARLHLVGDEEDAVAPAEGGGATEVAHRRDDHACAEGRAGGGAKVEVAPL